MEASGKLKAPGHFTPRKEPRYLLNRVPQPGWTFFEEGFLPLPEFEPQGFRLIAWVMYSVRYPDFLFSKYVKIWGRRIWNKFRKHTNLIRTFFCMVLCNVSKNFDATDWYVHILARTLNNLALIVRKQHLQRVCYFIAPWFLSVWIISKKKNVAMRTFNPYPANVENRVSC